MQEHSVTARIQRGARALKKDARWLFADASSQGPTAEVVDAFVLKTLQRSRRAGSLDATSGRSTPTTMGRSSMSSPTSFYTPEMPRLRSFSSDASSTACSNQRVLWTPPPLASFPSSSTEDEIHGSRCMESDTSAAESLPTMRPPTFESDFSLSTPAFPTFSFEIAAPPAPPPSGPYPAVPDLTVTKRPLQTSVCTDASLHSRPLPFLPNGHIFDDEEDEEDLPAYTQRHKSVRRAVRALPPRPAHFRNASEASPLVRIRTEDLQNGQSPQAIGSPILIDTEDNGCPEEDGSNEIASPTVIDWDVVQDALCRQGLEVV